MQRNGFKRGMMQFSDFERQQIAAMRGPKQELIICAECGSKWFETVQVAQFDANKIGTIGQNPLMEVSYSILRCIRCGELHEPPVNRTFNHPEAKKYDELLDTLEEPEEKWGGRRKVDDRDKTSDEVKSDS